MFLATKERRFVKQAIKQLLRAHSTVAAKQPELEGKALYKEILLHTGQIDEKHVDKMLQQAEGSIDEWTAPGRTELGFREVVHYFVFSRYVAAGNKGTIVSLRTIVDTLVPPHI